MFINGQIITTEPDLPLAQSIAIRGDVILAVGSNEDALEFQSRSTVIVDLDGKTVLPGFVGKNTTQSKSLHTLGQGSPVTARMGAKDDATMTPLGRSGAALAGTAGVLLDPRLSSATGHLGPGLGVVSTLPLISLVDHHGLVDKRGIHGHVEDGIAQFDAV